MKHKKLLLADYRFPCDLPCVAYPLLGNPTKNALSRSAPEPARVRLITAVVVTVVVLAMNRDSPCDFLAMNGVRRRRLNPSADAGGPAGQKAALWVRRRR